MEVVTFSGITKKHPSKLRYLGLSLTMLSFNAR